MNPQELEAFASKLIPVLQTVTDSYTSLCLENATKTKTPIDLDGFVSQLKAVLSLAVDKTLKKHVEKSATAKPIKDATAKPIEPLIEDAQAALEYGKTSFKADSMFFM